MAELAKKAKEVQSISWWVRMLFLGALLGAIGAAYLSPHRAGAQRLAELHAVLVVWEYTPPTIKQSRPAPPSLLAAQHYYLNPQHPERYAADIDAAKRLCWLAALGAGAGALCIVLLINFISNPSLLLSFFKPGGQPE